MLDDQPFHGVTLGGLWEWVGPAALGELSEVTLRRGAHQTAPFLRARATNAAPGGSGQATSRRASVIRRRITQETDRSRSCAVRSSHRTSESLARKAMRFPRTSSVPLFMGWMSSTFDDG